MTAKYLHEAVARWMLYVIYDTRLSDREIAAETLGVTNEELIRIARSVIKEGVPADEENRTF